MNNAKISLQQKQQLVGRVKMAPCFIIWLKKLNVPRRALVTCHEVMRMTGRFQKAIRNFQTSVDDSVEKGTFKQIDLGKTVFVEQQICMLR